MITFKIATFEILIPTYAKRDDFNFPIVNFPFICSNIPAAHVYGVYISPFIVSINTLSQMTILRIYATWTR
jgi:hypothetical protein